MTPGALSRDDLLALLAELAEELSARDAVARLFVVGGAAMSLAFDDRRSTRDVDGAFEPSADVRAAAAVIGARHGLAPDWLNDGAKGYMPGNDPGATLAFDAPSLHVELASPEYMLAMKVHAARVEQDVDDIRTLYRVLGLTTVEEGLDITARYYGSAGMGRTLLPRSGYLLAEVVDGIRSDPVPAAEARSSLPPPGQPVLSFRCGRCGRRLWSWRSMKRGLGPGCATRD